VLTLLRRYGLHLVGLVLIAWVLMTSDLEKVGAAFAGLSPIRVVAIALLVLPGAVLKSWRWERLLRGLRVRIPAARVLLVGVYGMALGFLSPGRVGEFTKIGFLKREAGLSLPLGTFSVVADRVLDLFVLFLVLVTGVAYFVRGTTLVAALLFGFAAALLCAGVLAVIWRFRPRGLTADVESLFRPGPVLLFLALSLAATTLHFGQNTLLAWELGLDLGFWQVGFATTLASMVALLPVTVMGIGTREVALIYALGLFGIDRSGAVSFSLLVFAVHLFVFLSVAGAGSLLLPPVEKGADGGGPVVEYPENKGKF
jgi:uncharacterized membrane protein YbhN (UPF0104 family)